MEHTHTHAHNHAHEVEINTGNKNVFIIGIALNMAFVIAEASTNIAIGPYNLYFMKYNFYCFVARSFFM